MPRTPIAPDLRFFPKVTMAGDCWLWTGKVTPNGYGSFRGAGSRETGAHRWSYEFFRAEIPAGLQLDHLCRVTRCVNPWHLEPVTARVNTMRAEAVIAENARKTHCVHGHPFDPANTYVASDGHRSCRTCQAAAERRYRTRQAVAS
jgi:HNH endonuclease